MAQIIAEFCQNHNGDIDLLARMIEAAAKSGATHGKIQSILADTISYRPQFEKGLVVDGKIKAIKRPYKVEYDRLKQLELSHKETERFIYLCSQNGLIPMTTCFYKSNAKYLSEVGFRSIKVASYDCASFPMLSDLSLLFDDIIVSTGATFEDEIKHSAKILKGQNFAFLHCVTLYPTPLDQMHLIRMKWLKSLTSRVGFSDHSLVKRDGLIATKAALALGADVIERHFTILDSSKTKDGPISILPDHLEEIASFSKLSIDDRINTLNNEYPNWNILLGDSNRELSDEELLNRDYYRGRFASPRKESKNGTRMIFNWESTKI